MSLTPLQWADSPDPRRTISTAMCEHGVYQIERKQQGNRPGKVWTVSLDGHYITLARDGPEAKRIAAAHRANCRRLRPYSD